MSTGRESLIDRYFGISNVAELKVEKDGVGSKKFALNIQFFHC
jgi:hypothetical protein